jgi:hypothetical protein
MVEITILLLTRAERNAEIIESEALTRKAESREEVNGWATMLGKNVLEVNVATNEGDREDEMEEGREEST